MEVPITISKRCSILIQKKKKNLRCLSAFKNMNKYYAVQILSVVTQRATMFFKKSKLLLYHSDISQT